MFFALKAILCRAQVWSDWFVYIITSPIAASIYFSIYFSTIRAEVFIWNLGQLWSSHYRMALKCVIAPNLKALTRKQLLSNTVKYSQIWLGFCVTLVSPRSMHPRFTKLRGSECTVPEFMSFSQDIVFLQYKRVACLNLNVQPVRNDGILLDFTIHLLSHELYSNMGKCNSMVYVSVSVYGVILLMLEKWSPLVSWSTSHNITGQGNRILPYILVLYLQSYSETPPMRSKNASSLGCQLEGNINSSIHSQYHRHGCHYSKSLEFKDINLFKPSSSEMLYAR